MVLRALKKKLPARFEEKISVFLAHSANRPIRNFFGSRHDRHALISYITSPFRRGAKMVHTNTVEVLEIAKIFDELGYCVDVVYYDEQRSIEYNRYSVIFGFGDPLVRSFYFRSRPICTIYYGTGMHMSHQNTAALQRAKDVFRKRGIWLLESCRIVEKAYSVQTMLVDAMIVLGNDVVVDSYRRYYAGRIINVNPSYLKVYDPDEILRTKDISLARKNYCWFGGKGMVHKGLDMLLEVFSDFPEYHLHICGPIENEPRFMQCYREELYGKANIHNHGFVRLDSPLFRKILSTCAFTVFPSCSEGAPSSVLNVMGNGGLIPIVTREVGIDTKDFGIPIVSATVSGVRTAVLESAALDEAEVRRRSDRSAASTATMGSVENYYRQMKGAISAILGDLQ